MKRKLVAILGMSVAVSVMAGVQTANADPPSNIVRQWGGVAGDVPMTGDFDGDGRSDIAIWRPGSGNWYIINSSNNWDVSNAFVTQWGQNGDKPYLGDVDGDGRADLVIYRPSTSTFYVKHSTNGYSINGLTIPWTQVAGNDKFYLADIDGDNRQDIIAYRPNIDGAGASQYLALSSRAGFNDYFARYVNWGVQSDLATAGKTSGLGADDLVAYRPSTGHWYPVNSAAGPPFSRLDTVSGAANDNYTYAPDIIKQGSTLYMFACHTSLYPGQNRIDGGLDAITVSKSTDAGSTWSARERILAVNPGTEATTGHPGNNAYCDPSIVKYQGFYYLYNSNTIYQCSGCYQTYITVSRLAATLPLDSPASSWSTYTVRGTWENKPSDAKAMVLPKVIRSSGAQGYGAGQQSLIVRNGQLEMYYVDDSLAPVDFDPGINNCFALWKLTSTNPVSWNTSAATATNTCGHSPVVKWDPARSRYALVKIQWAHNTKAFVSAQYSSDGVSWGSPVTVVDEYVLPDYAHNLGMESDDQGYLVSGEVPWVAWGGLNGFRVNNNWFVPWDLLGARLDVASGSPIAASSDYTLSGGAGAQPLMGDIDSDGKDEPATFNASSGVWKFLKSTAGYNSSNVLQVTYGIAGDIGFLAHFNPAGVRDDMVVYRPSSGYWYIAYS